MELLILDKNFNRLQTLTTFESLIWTRRYNEYGDFEIYTYVDANLLRKATIGNYLYLVGSNEYMIIEQIRIITDSETGNRLMISGVSLEAILSRRILWGQVNIEGNLQSSIQSMLNSAIISPTDTNRQISNFIFETSTDEYITGLTLTAQFFSDNLYDVIKTICQTFSLGFEIYINDSNVFVFRLYYGIDRTYNQLLNPYVVFSPKFTNLVNSYYNLNNLYLKNTVLVGGEGEGSDKILYAISGTETGIDRREMYEEASDVSSTTDEGVLTPEEYLTLLASRGESALGDNILSEDFSGQIENSNKYYKYGIDYFLGDIVQLKNEYGLEASVRVLEIIKSQSSLGINIYPTLSSI